MEHIVVQIGQAEQYRFFWTGDEISAHILCHVLENSSEQITWEHMK